MANIIDFPGMNSGNEDISEENAEKAQDLIYDAWDNDSTVARKRLARKALELDPHCADAYCLLAEEYQSIDKKKEYYTKGIEAFAKRHDEEYFKENTGYFWGLVETRPYMRLCAGYGNVLWETGEKEAAIAQYETLLKLNPNDNQGVRYSLIDWLLATGEFEKVKNLLKNYNEGSAFILFSKLLLIIKTEPANTKKLTAAYLSAARANPSVIQYLLSRKDLPANGPEYYGPGDDNEAIIYCTDAKAIWEADGTAMSILHRLADK